MEQYSHCVLYNSRSACLLEKDKSVPSFKKTFFVDTSVHYDGELSPVICSSGGLSRSSLCETGILYNEDVVLFELPWKPINSYLVDLFLTLDRIKREGVNSITLVIPYLPYSRQDRETAHEGKLISVSCIANILETFPLRSVITYDLHKPQIQGMFRTPVFCVSKQDIFLQYIQNTFNPKDVCLVAPDMGGIYEVSLMAKKMQCPYTYLCNKRNEYGKEDSEQISNAVSNRDVIILDDIISSGRTIRNAADYSKNCGAKSVHVCATHILSELKDIERNLTDVSSLISTDIWEGSRYQKTVSIKESIHNVLRSVLSCK